ncbi:MAG TPA: multicopper oxidase domain-containing protein [Actinophytocola sp.]|nr:multicopper oxidase domain-containing protein [Actinophytocola sp.]HEU5470242.1 multicopper oxidase domain-containing protein [Actinophytocola sp.]
MTDRRAVLRWGLAGTLGLALPAGTAVLAGMRPRVTPAGASAPAGPPAGAFTRPLPVPPVLSPQSTDGGVDRYEIRQTVGRQRLLPDSDTEIWGYNGMFPGPTVRARRGRPVVLAHRNELSVPTVVHLHGGAVPPEQDGHPLDYVLPAAGSADAELAAHARHGVAGLATGSREYRYANDQPAATLWYHDHRMGFTGPAVYRGLAGFYLIHDEVEDALPLPRERRDVPLLVADRAFADDGSLFYPAVDPTGREPGVTALYHHSGMVGETVTVNGVAWPYLEVDAALYRLRFLNASNARPYRLELDPPPPGGSGFVQIGSDLGLLPRPAHYDMFVLSPGERYDVLIDFSRYPSGTRVVLRNNVAEGDPGYVMRFDVGAKVADDARIPAVLTPEPAPPPRTTGTADRRFSFFSGAPGVRGPAMINGQAFGMTRIDARVAAGSTEIWDLTADPIHPVHLHGARFRILKRNGAVPEPQDAGWKDTVFLPDGGMRLAVEFGGHRGRYVFHCHNLEHGDTGMMATLDIT